jgi:hypothetical protein
MAFAYLLDRTGDGQALYQYDAVQVDFVRRPA